MAASLIETVFLEGKDQFECMFSLLFQRGLPGTRLIPPNLLLRLDEEFDIPEEKNEEKLVWIRGLSIPKPVMKEATDKHFILDFRLDENWLVYNVLKKWKTGWFDTTFASQNNGKLSISQIVQGEKTLRADIDFVALNRRRRPAKRFLFKSCAINSLKTTPWKNSGGNPSRVMAVISFVRMEVPGIPIFTGF